MSSVLAEEAVSRGYSLHSLQEAIERSKANVQMYEDLADKERNQIKEFRLMIDAIEQAERQKAEALANVSIEVVRDDGES